MNVDNDRKHCAASRRVTNRRTKTWRIVLKVLTSNLLEPSMSSVFNPYTYISRNTLIHTYYITARVTKYKDQTSVLYSSSSSRVNNFFSIRIFCRPFAVCKVAMATSTSTSIVFFQKAERHRMEFYGLATYRRLRETANMKIISIMPI